MDWIQTLAISTLGAAIIKLMDLGLDSFKQSSSRRVEIIQEVQEYLHEYTNLISLYNFFARTESNVKTDEEGRPIRDEDGKYVTEQHIMEPDPRDESTFQLKGTTLDDAISQQRVSIVLKSEKAHDLINELDPSKALSKKFHRLHWLTLSLLEKEIEEKDLSRFVEVRHEATELRREINSILQSHYPRGPLRILSQFKNWLHRS